MLNKVFFHIFASADSVQCYFLDFILYNFLALSSFFSNAPIDYLELCEVNCPLMYKPTRNKKFV